MLRFILFTLLLVGYLSAGAPVRQVMTLKPSPVETGQREALLASTRSFSSRPFPYQRVAMPPKQSYQEKYCVQVNTQWTVCHHVPLDSDEDYFALLKEGRLVGIWPSQIGFEGGARLEVVTADLDGDHQAELNVAHCLGINTVNHEIWRLAIIPSFAACGFTKPLQFEVVKYFRTIKSRCSSLLVLLAKVL